jgi:hypothetical protein
MTKKMKKHFSNKKYKLEFYKALSKVPKDMLQTIFHHLDDRSVDLICECVYNTIYTDMNLPNKTKKKLKTHLRKHCCLKNLKVITNKKNSVSKRREALKQEGKGIPFILSAILPLITKLFTG